MSKKKSRKSTNILSLLTPQKKRLLLLIVGVVLLGISAILQKNKIFALSFVDEQSNMIMGYFLLKGEKIYGDIFQHHQPLTYIISAFLQKIVDPKNLYTLIQRHREFIILWSTIWSLVLLYRFGFVVLPFIAIYELTKMYLFGNLFLRESLAVYPLLYLLLYIFSSSQKKKIDIFLLGMVLTLPVLMMAPVWPLCFFILIILLYKLRLSIREGALMILGGLPFVLLSLYFSSFKDYLFNIFYINFAYYIPSGDDSLLVGAIKGFLTPFISFLPTLPSSSMLWIIRSLSLSLIVYSVVIMYKYKNYKLILLIFTLLGLANFRYVQPGMEIYSGFHSLPWFALLIMAVSILFIFLWRKTETRSMKASYSLFLVGVFVVSGIFSSKILFENHDPEHDKYVNYSRLYDYGEAIRIMKSDNDTLFVIPDQRLLYWQGKINHASKSIVYYPWMDAVPPIKDEIDSVFKNTPPTFLYCKKCNPRSYPDYTVLYKHEEISNLFVHKSKVSSLSSSQLEDIQFFGFYFRK